MEKHAYLIMAHNNFYTLEKLLSLLDDPGNDIFLHIDKKAKQADLQNLRDICTKSGVYFTRRLDVKWGSHHQVRAEMLLFRAAWKKGPYRYYHFISGCDLPLKSQTEIHSFFADKTVDYISCDQTAQKDLERIATYRYVFGKDTEKQRLFSEYADILQRKLKVDRLKKISWPVRKGANWVSLTQGSVEVLMKHRTAIRRFTRFGFCADEIYKQTVLIGCGRPFENNNLRLIDWSRGGDGHPYTFTEADFDLLTQSEKLFARKFDEKTDRRIIDRIAAYVRGDR